MVARYLFRIRYSLSVQMIRQIWHAEWETGPYVQLSQVETWEYAHYVIFLWFIWLRMLISGLAGLLLLLEIWEKITAPERINKSQCSCIVICVSLMKINSSTTVEYKFVELIIIRLSIYNWHDLIIQAKRGCPQGGVLSPLFWFLVVDRY